MISMYEKNLSGFAALSVNHGPSSVGMTALSLANEGGATWQQLLPAGYFSAIDGRPKDVPNGKWFLNREHAESLIAKVISAVNDIVIDYEHQTLNSSENGKPAPAAGWFKDGIEWREGSGLWIRPRWTSKALDFIRQDEYRYLSAVFSYDKVTGVPTSLHSAALVNKPGLDGLKEVDALKSYQASHCGSHSTAVLPEETTVALKSHLSESEYQEARTKFCASKGTTWTALTSITSEDQAVIKLCGLDQQDFQKSKIELLAKEVVTRFGILKNTLPYRPATPSHMVLLSETEITANESKVALKSGLSDRQYLEKRASYCARKGTNWAALTSLTKEEYAVMEQCGMDQESFQKSKIELMARDIALGI